MLHSKVLTLFLGFLVLKVNTTPVADNAGYEVIKTLAKRSADLNSGLDMLAAVTAFSSNDDCHNLRTLLPTVRSSVTSAYGQATDLASFLNQVYQEVRNGCLSTNVVNDTVCLTGQAVVVKNVYVRDKDTYISSAQEVASSVKAFGEALMGCIKSL